MRPDAPPLTHHEILSRVGPFARAGRAVDLDATDRDGRRIAFRATAHPPADGLPALHERLTLDLADPAHPRLVRELAAAEGNGPAARLEAEGADAGELLGRIDAVPAARQWRIDDGGPTALQHRVDADGQLHLRQAEARVAGLALRLKVSGVSGFPAEIEIRPTDDRNPGPRLPSDLLAVLGRHWTRLSAVGRGWQARVDVRGDGAARGAAAEALLVQAVGHLGRTLSEPPARFHERHRAARWGVALREMLPMGVGVGIVALAFLVQRHSPERASVLALLANVAPPLLMGLFFLRREMPHIGLPRVPRRPPAGAWPVPGEPR